MMDMKVLHVLPDRVRLKVPAVRNMQTAQRLESISKDIEGIHWVRANAKCAGLVVRFDGAMHTTSDIICMLQQIATEGNA